MLESKSENSRARKPGTLPPPSRRTAKPRARTHGFLPPRAFLHSYRRGDEDTSFSSPSSSSSSSSSPLPLPHSHSLSKHALSVLVAGAVTLASTAFTAPPASSQPVMTPDEKNSIEVFRRTDPSIVFVQNLQLKQDTFTLNLEEFPQGAGSGIVWDSEGRILTNYHVVKDSAQVSVTVGTGLESIEYTKTRVVGVDPDKDIALLQIIPDENRPIKLAQTELFKPMPLGSSSDLIVGQKVYALGHPFGLQHSITTGIISGLDREIPSGINGKPIEGVIQTDAPINPGNSGGALVDTSGEMVGLNTAIYSPSGGSAGVGFALAIDDIKSSVDQIVQYGRVVRPFLGISFAPDPSVSQLGIQGVLILDTKPDGPCSKAGIKGTTRDDYGRLQLGDIIIGMQEKPVKNSSDLYRILNKTKVGETIDLFLLREKSKEHVKVTLESRDDALGRGPVVLAMPSSPGYYQGQPHSFVPGLSPKGASPYDPYYEDEEREAMAGPLSTRAQSQGRWWSQGKASIMPPKGIV